MERRELNKKIEALEEKLNRRLKQQRVREDSRVSEAIRDVYTWVTQYTKTFNAHWIEEGRPSAYEPFPQREYFKYLFAMIKLERINWIEKSRDMMVSWSCVAYFTLQAMTVSEREVLFQTQTEEKSKQLVRYAKILYDMQPQWLQDAFPVTKPVWKQREMELHFAHGGSVIGIPSGANQIRSYHP
jgi:hypothetical protein